MGEIWSARPETGTKVGNARDRPNLSDLRRVRPSELEGQVPMPFGKLAGKATGRPRRT